MFSNGNPDSVRENFVKEIENYVLYSYKLTQQNTNVIMIPK